ncbi:potassium-transporting ATPase subunit F [Leminorella grimontii]|nr:potassium-transporting ATPase subunit F [Leminorella grimontii]
MAFEIILGLLPLSLLLGYLVYALLHAEAF